MRVAGNINVDNNADVAGTLSVTGSGNIGGDLVVGQDLTVDGATTLESAVSAAGPIYGTTGNLAVIPPLGGALLVGTTTADVSGGVLQVNGGVDSRSGYIISAGSGYKFPDGTTQSTAFSQLNIANTIKSNLQASNSTTSVTVKADTLSVQGVILISPQVSASPSLTNTPGGTDGSSLVFATWLAVVVICGPTGGSPALVLTSNTANSYEPSGLGSGNFVGYTNWRRVGWVRWTGSALVPTTRQSNNVIYNDPTGTNASISTGVSSLASYVPPSTQLATVATGATSVFQGGYVAVRTPGSSNYVNITAVGFGDGNYGATYSCFEWLLDSSQNIDLSGSINYIQVVSYVDPV